MSRTQADVFVPRLRIAFKWMVRAFSGYLSTDQLLLLWDRILGYDSLEVVAGKRQPLFSLLFQSLLFPHAVLHFFLYSLSVTLSTPLSSSSPSGSCVCLPGREPDGGDVTGLSWGASVSLYICVCVCVCVCVSDTLVPVLCLYPSHTPGRL